MGKKGEKKENRWHQGGYPEPPEANTVNWIYKPGVGKPAAPGGAIIQHTLD